MIDHAGACLGEIVGMNMDIPEPWQEIRATQVDHVGIPGVGRMRSIEDLADPSSLDHDATANYGQLAHTVDDVRVG